VEVDEFWAVIEHSRESGETSSVGLSASLAALLTGRSRDDLIAFAEIFHRQSFRAHREDLWAAAEVIAGEMGDSSFIEVRSWLVSLGRQRFERAIQDPDSLADVPDAWAGDISSFEIYAGAVLDAWEQTHEGQLPAHPGLDFDFDDPDDRGSPDDPAAVYPRLVARYGAA
jgi:hypothetical protein